jgi:RNase P/RNase MRP subunit p30
MKKRKADREIGEEIVKKEKKDKMLIYKMRKNTPSPHQMKKKIESFESFWKLIYMRDGAC